MSSIDLHLTVADWLAIASVVLPIVAKAAADIAADMSARHNDAMERIANMASRQAAALARTIQSLPPDADSASVEKTLIQSGAQEIIAEMGSSAKITGATSDKIAKIIQGELAKITVAISPPAVPPQQPASAVAVKVIGS